MHPTQPKPDTSYLPNPADYDSMVHYKRQGVDTFAAYYCTVDDVLVLKVWSPSGATTVNVSIRFQTPDGRIVPIFFSQSITTAGVTPSIIPLQQVEGFILSATVETPGASRGSAFVMLIVRRGQGTGDATTGQLLLSGYPGAGFAVGYPATPAASPLDGRGSILVQTVGNPAAGADWSFTIPAGLQMILRSLRCRLTTSAAVANRIPLFSANDGAGHGYYEGAVNSVVAASLAFDLMAFHGATGTVISTQAWAGLPFEMRMLPGHVIQSQTGAIQAADQYSAIVLLFEQFISA
jgi:hypothetical protein